MEKTKGNGEGCESTEKNEKAVGRALGEAEDEAETETETEAAAVRADSAVLGEEKEKDEETKEKETKEKVAGAEENKEADKKMEKEDEEALLLEAAMADFFQYFVVDFITFLHVVGWLVPYNLYLPTYISI